MAEKIATLLTDKDLYDQLKQSGLEYVQRFSWEKMSKETHQLYMEAV